MIFRFSFFILLTVNPDSCFSQNSDLLSATISGQMNAGENRIYLIEEDLKSYQFQKFSKEDLKKDLIALFNKMDSTHYNLYHKHSKEDFKAKHAQLILGITDSMNLFEFYYHSLPLFDMIVDAHSLLVFPFSYTREYESQGGKFIPIEVKIKNGQIYIEKNHAQQAIPCYSQVIAVNNVTSKDIIEKLSIQASYERVQSEDKYMSLFFRRILYPLYGFDKNYDVLIITPEGKERLISLKGITSNVFRKEKEPYYSFHTIGDSVGVIDINLCEGRYQFSSFCDSVFTLLKEKNIPNLIIDVRDNGGGSSFHGDTLFTYITDKKFTQYGRVKLKMSPMVNSDLETIHFEKYRKHKARSYYNPKLFQGDVYMIANQNSFSSATMLAATFKCYNMGTLVGEETGGVEVFFDEPIVMSLPHTGIRFLASYQYRQCPCGKRLDRGITPDFDIDWSAKDKIDGVDTELEFILNLIGEKR